MIRPRLVLNDSEILFDEKEGNDLIEASLDGEEALGEEKAKRVDDGLVMWLLLQLVFSLVPVTITHFLAAKVIGFKL